MPNEITSPIYTGDPLAPGDITRGQGLFGGQGGLQNQLEMEGTDASALYEAAKTKEWDDLKEAYENDEATLLDLRNFDPGVLSNNETWLETARDFIVKESQLSWNDVYRVLIQDGMSPEEAKQIIIDTIYDRTNQNAVTIEGALVRQGLADQGYNVNVMELPGESRTSYSIDTDGDGVDDTVVRGYGETQQVIFGAEVDLNDPTIQGQIATKKKYDDIFSGTYGDNNDREWNDLEDWEKNKVLKDKNLLDCTENGKELGRCYGDETTVDPNDTGSTDDGTSASDCIVVNQENADECGFEIDENGNLIDKDRDPDSVDDDSVAPFYTNCGGGIFAKTEEDCPEMEGTGGYSEKEQSTAEAIKDWIEGKIGEVKDMTVDDVLVVVFGGSGGYTCELTGEGEEPWDCAGTDGSEGNQCWKDCVSASVLGGIPGLPMPPGNIDVGTVRDLENTANEIGTTIGGILNPDPDDEGFIEKVKNWVIGKIDDVFGGIDDVTLGDITGWITGTLGNVLGGLILIEVEGATNTVKEKINEIIFGITEDPTTLINCGDYGREGGEVKSIEECDGCSNKSQEIGTDGRCRDKDVVDDFTVDCASEGMQGDRGTKQGDKVTGCGPCLSTHQEIDGQCVEWKDNGDTEDDCIALNREYIPSPAAGTKSSCGQCEEGFDPDANNPTGPCIPSLDNCQARGLVKDDITGKCVESLDCTPDTPCTTEDGAPGKYGDKCDCIADFVNPGFTAQQCEALGRYHVAAVPEQSKPSECGDCKNGSTNEDCSIECPEGTPKKGQMVANIADCGTPSTLIECPEDTPKKGQMVANIADCGTTTYTCPDPNATTNEDGSCGPCKTGYVYDGALERCVQTTVVDPCLDSAYAEANPTICGTDPECNDCTCAEYAADNPDECGTTPPPPPPPPSGGGGAGGSTFGSGMFDMTPTDITAAPELLAAANFPIVDFLSDALPKNVKSNVMKGLFEGLV